MKYLFNFSLLLFVSIIAAVSIGFVEVDTLTNLYTTLTSVNGLPITIALLTACPPAAEISDVDIDTCPESFGQTQKSIFQRTSSAGVPNTIPVGSGAGGVEIKATWTALKAASDSTKVVVSPYLQSPETEPGERRTYGGGNATLGGIEITLGAEPTTFEAMILQSKQKTILDLKTYYNEGSNLGVYLIDEYGRIGCLVNDHDTPTIVSPIPIQAFFVGDKNLGGYEEPDSNKLSWAWAANWSDMFHIITPTDFKALTEL